MSTDYFPGLHMSIDHHGQHPDDGELTLDATETTILDTFVRALTLHPDADDITSLSERIGMMDYT